MSHLVLVNPALFGCSNCGKATTRAPARWSLPAGCPRSLTTCWAACVWKPSGRPATCRSSSPRPCCSWWPPCSPTSISPSGAAQTLPWIQVAFHFSPHPFLASVPTVTVQYLVQSHESDSMMGPACFLLHTYSPHRITGGSHPEKSSFMFCPTMLLKWHFIALLSSIFIAKL